MFTSSLMPFRETPEFYFQQEMPIFYSLFQALNATIEINIYNYHGHGGINKSTGKLIVDGLVGDLYRKKIDISCKLRYWLYCHDYRKTFIIMFRD